MLGMLSAIPKAPLYDRMVKEGRLDTAAELRFSTNIVPLHIGRERLRDGFVYVLSALNDTAAYFDRLEASVPRAPAGLQPWGRTVLWRRHPWRYGPRPGASFSVRPSVSWLGSHGRWGMPPFAASISGGPGGSFVLAATRAFLTGGSAGLVDAFSSAGATAFLDDVTKNAAWLRIDLTSGGFGVFRGREPIPLACQIRRGGVYHGVAREPLPVSEYHSEVWLCER